LAAEMMKTTIDKMRTSDLLHICDLSAQLGYSVDLARIQERFSLLDLSPYHAFFVYREAEQILGWLHLEKVFDLIEEFKTEIKVIVIEKGQRGKGIGHSLINTAKEWSKIQGTNIIFLNCNIIRPQAHAFYLKEGFKQVRTSHFFELNL
jgi:(aminoalkyl)phosphonate N-acetyltransferase